MLACFKKKDYLFKRKIEILKQSDIRLVNFQKMYKVSLYFDLSVQNIQFFGSY